MQRKYLWLLLVLTLIFASCGPGEIFSTTITPSLSITITPTLFLTPTITLTPTQPPTSTQVPTITPMPIYSLGSPFGKCGDGIVQIWSNDSYDGVIPASYDSKMDNHHGHVDILRPNGCNSIIVYAPANGILSNVGYHNYDLTLDSDFRLGLNPANPPGFAIILDPILSADYTEIVLKMAHFTATVPDGSVIKGQEIGKLVMEHNQWKIAYQVTTSWRTQQIWSPTLFIWDQQPVCVIGSPYDCIPTLDDYAP